MILELTRIFFWLVLAGLFFIIWRKGSDVDALLERNDYVVSAYGYTSNGDAVRVPDIDRIAYMIDTLGRAIKQISKIGGLGMLISLLSALGSIFL